MNIYVLRRGRLVIFAALLMLLLQGRAGATPLNLVPGSPDLTASFLTFAFDSTGGVCGAGSDYTLCFSGDPAFISSYGLTPEIADATTYQLVAGVDPLTGLLTATGGTFAIGNYLTGTVNQFGYAIDGGAAVLEFLIDITGGSLQSQFDATQVGVIGAIFNWGTVGFGPDLGTVISSGDVMTDNFDLDPPPIPEPATLCLLGVGLFAVSAARFRRRRAK